LERLSTGDNFADDKEEDVESLLKRYKNLQQKYNSFFFSFSPPPSPLAFYVDFISAFYRSLSSQKLSSIIDRPNNNTTIHNKHENIACHFFHLLFKSQLFFLNLRLSNETISSPYDDRLDKKDGGGLIGPPTSRSR